MGRRKNKSSALKKPQSSSSTSASPTYVISPLENEELKRIHAAYSGGKLEEAFKMAENACQSYKDCSFFHRLHAKFARELSIQLCYEGEINRGLLYKAIVSSQRATALIPNSMEYRYFHASMLSAVAVLESKGFKKVLGECERALAIENPEEPFWDLYMSKEDKCVKLKNRPGHIRKYIDRLIAMTCSYSTQKRNLIETLLTSSGNQVEEGQTLAEKMYPNQIMSEAGPMVERRRRKTNIKVKAADYRRLLQIRNYWNSMSHEMKRNLFQVRVEDLKKHCHELLKDVVKDCNILDRILPVFSQTKRWSFYLCYTCRGKFFDVDKLMQHGCIHTIKDLNSSWPSFVNDVLVDDILNNSWKPCHVREVLRMIEEEHLTVEEVLQNCPLSNDSERTQCINRIQDKLRCMIEKGILCNSHVNWLKWNVYKCIPSKYMNHISTVDLHLCIGLLQLHTLQEVLRSLENIIGACGSLRITLYYDNDDVIPKVKFPSFTLNSSLDTITLDTCFFRNNKGTSGDAEDVESNHPINIIDSDGLLSLIFYCQAHKEFLVSKICGMEDKENMWKSSILIKDDYFSYLSTYFETKDELYMHINAIKIVSNFCSEEHKKMTDREESRSDFIARLSNHQRELDAVGSNLQFLESIVMDKVIIAAKSVNHHMDQYFDQVKIAISSSIYKQCEEIHQKVNELDAKMLWALSLIEKIDQMLRSLSFLDYKEIISILLASFVQLSLENLVKKDALEQTVAAGEDLLKQESKDAKKKITVGVDTSNIMHDRNRKNEKRKHKRTIGLKETMGLDGASKDLDFSQEKTTGTSYPLLENVVASENYLVQQYILGNDKIIVEEIEEHNYFLNVIFKSLWHLRWFLNSFKNSVPSHTHVGDTCVFCNMNDIFVSLDNGARGGKMELISHHTQTILSILKNSYGDRNFLTEVNVAPKAFAVILLLLHILSLSTLEEHGARSEESPYLDQYCCRCLAHTVFGTEIHENVKNNCNIESQESRYTSWFYKVDVHVPSRAQGTNQVCFFNHLFKDLATGELSTSPRVLAAVINWHKECGGAAHISSILAAIDTHIELSVVHHGGDNTNKYSLVCMICYCRPKLQCFTYSDENEKWTILNGEIEKEIGGWNDVKQICITKNLQPEILFFEAEN